MALVVYLKPASILDIGVGFGKYGVLCREYLELWDGRGNYSEFLRRIDGVEAFKDYITPLHKFVYNRLYDEDAINIIDKIDIAYDLVLLIDVLEHFNKEQGNSLLSKVIRNNKGAIISTPKKVSDQKEAFNNKYEIHKSQWTKDELSAHGESFFLSDPVSHIVYLSNNKDQVASLRTEFLMRKVKQIPAMNFFIRTSKRLTAKYKRLIGG